MEPNPTSLKSKKVGTTLKEMKKKLSIYLESPFFSEFITSIASECEKEIDAQPKRPDFYLFFSSVYKFLSALSERKFGKM